jgi:metal-responsive CopG/Arc/MetJ family transcriptional regulator
MDTRMVRLNISLPSFIAEELYQFSMPRKRSQFIAEAIKLQIKQLKEKKRKKLLEEGYKAANAEGLQLTKEFESVDIENWDEY